MLVSTRGGAVCAAAVFYCLASAAPPATARVETLRWAHEDPSAVEFYRVHVGSTSRQYAQTIEVGNKLSYDLTLGDSELAFVAITAHAGATASGYSNEKRLDPPAASTSSEPPPPSSSPSPSSGTSGNPSTSATLLLGIPLSKAVPLDGEVVAGNVYIQVEPEKAVYKVRFYLDDPKMNKTPLRTDRLYPFDLAGTLGVAPVTEPFDTKTLSDGWHVVTARVNYSSGEQEVLHADFQVQNQAAPPAGGTSPGSTANATLLLGIPVSAAVPLDGEVVAGNVYIHVESGASMKEVAFYLDDPAMNENPIQVERFYSYDFAGTNGSARNPFDTTTLADGWHAVTARVTYTSGTEEVLHADFEVRNGGGSATSTSSSSEPALLFLKSTENPNDPGRDLQGALVADSVFIFVSDPGGIERVTFYLDDPLRSKTPARIEEFPAYDFAGSHGDGEPNAFDTRTLYDGTHTVTAEIEWVGGGKLVIHADFLVANEN